MKTLVSIVGTKLLQVCAGALLQSHSRIEKSPLLTLTARSTPWEWEGKSGKLIFSPVNNEFCNSSSEKSSVSGSSQTPFTDKSIKSVQCTALKLIIGIFLNLFLTGFPLLKEYKKKFEFNF